MFDTIDHFKGAIKVRFRRFFLKLKQQQDISNIKSQINIGGHSQFSILAKNNFNAILDARKEDSDDAAELEKNSIEYLRIEIPDREIPTMDEANKAVNWISVQVKANKKILIHCNLGRGRGPLIACLYLIHTGMEPSNAIKLVI